jgi:hypothetical protein
MYMYVRVYVQSVCRFSISRGDGLISTLLDLTRGRVEGWKGGRALSKTFSMRRDNGKGN